MNFDLTLYLVTDSTGMEEETFLSRVEAACRGGVTLLQLREKQRGGGEYLHLARRVKEITDRWGIPLLIDDRVDVAMAADAAGVSCFGSRTGRRCAYPRGEESPGFTGRNAG